MPTQRGRTDVPISAGGAQFAELVRELISTTGLSVTELAEDAAVPRSSLYKVLAGQRIPSRGFMDLLSWSLEKHSTLLGQERSVLIEQLLELHHELRRALPKPRKPAPAVHVEVLPQQVELAAAFTAFLEELERREVDLCADSWIERDWLRRYARGDNIPSWSTLYDFINLLEKRGVEDAKNLVYPLQNLAEAALRARAEARRWARVLAGGDP
ncbi:helix-turn-helix domain-containing protein [Kitasatospora sp. NPDC058444]|uniref:helix-turn-helix domain-containing protein n=1 Tax=Kitasatospora sp. NPDC058444 TaxID=3346504 RepID=UPI0036660A31